ncbi:MAG: hypothetical protein QW231_06735 [Candidatus Bathyarchaeia archaeon]
MRFWEKKKKEGEGAEEFYEIYGGATIRRVGNGYEIRWKSPMVTTVTVSSPPEIDKDVLTSLEGDVTRIETHDCRLKIVKEGGKTRALISKI